MQDKPGLGHVQNNVPLRRVGDRDVVHYVGEPLVQAAGRVWADTGQSDGTHLNLAPFCNPGNGGAQDDCRPQAKSRSSESGEDPATRNIHGKF